MIFTLKSFAILSFSSLLSRISSTCSEITNTLFVNSPTAFADSFAAFQIDSIVFVASSNSSESELAMYAKSCILSNMIFESA